MRASRQFRPTAAAGALACTLLVAVTACSSSDKPSAPRPAPSSAAKSGTDRVPIADCQKIPPDGRVDVFSTENLGYGFTQRNLVTLQALDVVLRAVGELP